MVLCSRDHLFPLKIKKFSITMKIKTSILINLTMTKNMIRKNKTFINLLTSIIYHMKNHLRRKVVHTRAHITIYRNTPLPLSYKLSLLEKLKRIHSLSKQLMICGESSSSLTLKPKRPFQSYMDELNILRQ